MATLLATDAPRIGLGAMPLSLPDRPDRERAHAVIRAAVEAGVGLIDSADCYCAGEEDFGHNELLLRAALQECDSPPPLVATKGGLTRPEGRWQVDARPARLRRACEASLRRLGVERLPLYYLHSPDPEVPFADSLGELIRLREEGKIGHLGLSNVDREQLLQGLAMTSVAAVQNRCNILEKGDLDNGLVAECARRGVHYVAYSPVGGHNGHVRLAQVPALTEVAQEHDAGVHSVALAWLLAQGEHIIAIPGASRPESIRASALAARIQLSRAELERLDSIPDWR